MTSISRPGGPVGPGGPGELDGADDAAGVTATAGGVATATDPTAAMAAALDRGDLAPADAMAQLVDDAVAGLPPDEAAELRALMADFLAADPYLAGVGRELGVPPDPGGGE